MSGTQNKDLVREQVLKFIQALKQAPPFAAADCAKGLSKFLVDYGKARPLKEFTKDHVVDKNELYRDISGGHQEFGSGIEKLGAATLAMGLASLPEDEWGFVASANKTKAVSLANSSLMNIVPFLIEAHIDQSVYYLRTAAVTITNSGLHSELKMGGISQLRHLSKDDLFKEVYGDMLVSEAVLFSIEESNTIIASNYRSNLLFAYEFFRTGNTPYLYGTVPNTGQSQQCFADIVQAWLKQIQAPTESATFNEVFNKVLAAQHNVEAPETAVKDWSKFTQDLMQIVLPTDIVYLPSFNMAQGLPYIAETVMNSVAPEFMQDTEIRSKLLASIPQQTLSFAQELWTDWEKEAHELGQAVQQSINTDKVSEPYFTEAWNPGKTSLFQWLGQIHIQVKDHQVGVAVSEAQLGCRDEDVWNKKNNILRPAEDKIVKARTLVTRDRGLRWWQEVVEPPPSCFVAGTLVHTQRGSLSIETLGENDRVLTRADTGEWGLVSDERVRMPVKSGKVLLYGINDEPAFFTPNHPFVDKFGHVRAIDPTAAHFENPWLEVGPLKVGHVLLRTTNGKGYEEIPIVSLTPVEVETDYVYGIHLREGLRSYHANGYLVRMNYPEITIKSLADALRQISPSEQLRMIGHLHELQPLLSRFGQGTVLELLAAELRKSDSELLEMKQKHSPGPKAPGLYYQSRSFSLSVDWSSLEGLSNAYYAPTIDCIEGQVWIDGEACACARVLQRGFVWSRSLQHDESLWEHGMCTFGADHDMVVGDGFLWVDNDPSPHQPGPKAVQFQAFTIPLRDYNEMPLDNDSTEWITRGTQSSYAYIQANAEENSVWEADKAVAEDEDKEFAGVQEVVIGTAAFEERQKIVEKIDGPTPLPLSYEISEAVETFSLSYEPDSITDMPTGRPPVRVLEVQKIRKAVANGIQRFDFALPALDKLAANLSAKISETTPNSVHPQSFYETFVTHNEQNELCVKIRILEPERLALAADDNVSAGSYGDTAKSYQDLKYTKLGIPEAELIMPFIPSMVVLYTNTLHGLIAGQWIEFEPANVGDDGKWHSLKGSRLQAPTVPISPSHPSSGEPGASDTTEQKPKFLPPQFNLRSTQDLVTGFAINTVELKKDTQNLLKLAMYYHMNDEDRKEILGVKEKPTVTAQAVYGPDQIPSAMADELDPKLQTWIKGTYAPAWIAQNVTLLSPQQQQAFNIRIDIAWKRRLHYFFNGSGKRCLTQSWEYNELTTQASILTFRRKYPRIMTYVEDKTSVKTESENGKLKGMTGGKKWAHLLFESLMSADMVAHIARESQLTELTKLNTLEMYCTMLAALWRDDTGDKEPGTLTAQLSNAVRASLFEQAHFKHRCIDDPKQLENGIRDYILELFNLLLDEKAAEAAGISKGFREAMVESMKTYCDWKEDFAQRTARQNAEAMLASASATIKSAASYATGLTESPDTFRSGVRGATRVFNAIRRAVTGVKGDYSGQGSPPKIEPRPGTGALCFALGLTMTMLYVKQSWSSWGQWVTDESKLSPMDKARLVAGAMQAFGGLVFTTYKSLQLAKGWDPKVIGSIGEKTHAACRNLEKVVSSRSMHMHPDAVLEDTDFATRTRRNAVASRDLAIGTKKARNVQAALLPDSQKPKPWRQRVTDLKSSAKNKIKGWGQAVKARCQFNVAETVLRSYAVAASLAMLVIACITAGQAWAQQTLGEKILTVLNLITQFCNLIVEIAVIFCAVPGWVGIAVLIVGLVLQLIISWIVGTPEPPEPRIKTWWEINKPGSKGFLDGLPEEPPTTLIYTINQTKLTPGADTALAITGTIREQQPEKDLQRLKSINIYFSASNDPGKTKTLFDTKAQALADTMSEHPEPGPGETSIILPTSLQSDPKTGSTGDRSGVYACALLSMGPSLSYGSYSLGVEVDLTSVAQGQPLPSISLAVGEQIIFKMRGKIAPPAPKDENDKADYSKDTPPWNMFELRVVEAYADERDEFTGNRETVLDLAKI